MPPCKHQLRFSALTQPLYDPHWTCLDFERDTVGSSLYQHWMLYPIPMPLRCWCQISLAKLALSAAVEAAQVSKVTPHKRSQPEAAPLKPACSMAKYSWGMRPQLQVLYMSYPNKFSSDKYCSTSYYTGFSTSDVKWYRWLLIQLLH